MDQRRSNHFANTAVGDFKVPSQPEDDLRAGNNKNLLYLKRSQLEPVLPVNIERVFKENNKKREKNLRNMKS